MTLGGTLGSGVPDLLSRARKGVGTGAPGLPLLPFGLLLLPTVWPQPERTVLVTQALSSITQAARLAG